MLWQYNLLQDYCSNSLQTWNMVPNGTGNQRKPGKMGRHFPVGEKSWNFVKTGKVREYWKNWKKLHWKI